MNKTEMRGDQLTLWGTLIHLIRDAKAALADRSRIDQVLTIFWLLGPFVLLIERTPADIWLSLIGIAFVIRSIIKRDGSWLRS